MLSSLRSRVFAATALVAVLSMALVLGYVTVQVTRQAEGELRRQLEEAGRIVDQHHRVRMETGRERALLMADVPMLKAAVATGDPPTVERLTRDYPERVGGDLLLVTDANGEVLARRGGLLPDEARRSKAAEGFVVEEGRLVEFFTVPIVLGPGGEAPELLGGLTLGFVLNDAVTHRLASLTGSHVAVSYAHAIFASTLPRDHDAPLLALGAWSGVTRLDLGGEDWVALRQPLAGEEGPAVLVLESRTEALSALRTLRAALAVAALFAVVFSLLLSWSVARTVTRPLAAVTDAMREVADTGDLTRKLGPGRAWDDEDARLVARSFNTLTDSIARFQEEAALRDRLSALGRLSTIIAHEVRNPLMIIKGSLRVLRQKDATAEEVAEVAIDIDHEVARLDRIVSDVLDFTRPLQVEASPTDLAAICRDAAEAALGDSTDVTVRHALGEDLAQVQTDGERLRAALVNLVSNARDGVLARRSADRSSSQGDEIEIGGRRLDDGSVRLWVADQGVGIAADDLPQVFEPYFTTKRTGTGLGLAISRKIVEALGGRIHVDSHESGGTRIEIDLPARLPVQETERAT